MRGAATNLNQDSLQLGSWGIEISGTGGVGAIAAEKHHGLHTWFLGSFHGQFKGPFREGCNRLGMLSASWHGADGKPRTQESTSGLSPLRGVG